MTIDYEGIATKCEILYQAALNLDGFPKEQTRRLMRAREYGLTLDTIADTVIDNNVPMSAEVFDVFNELTTTMRLYRDPEYSAISELRTLTHEHMNPRG